MRTVSTPSALLSLLLLAAAHRASSEVASDINGPPDAIISGSDQNVTLTTTQKTPDAEATRQQDATSTSPVADVESPRIAAKQITGGVEFKALMTDFATKIVLEGNCSADQDCTATNYSSCVDGVCSCQPGYMPSKNLDRCLDVPSGLGGRCEEEAQCERAVPDSGCVDGACQCPLGRVFDQERCWLKQVVGGACKTSRQCEGVPSAGCAQGVCSCAPPLVPSPSNTDCLQPAGESYGAICAEDIQCTVSYGDEARCSHGRCRCVNAYHYNGSYCLPDLPLGADCLSDADCAVSEDADDGVAPPSRTCLMAHGCSCASGYERLNGEDLCVPAASAGQEQLVVTFTWLLCILVAKYLS